MTGEDAPGPARPMGFAGLRDLPAPPPQTVSRPPPAPPVEPQPPAAQTPSGASPANPRSRPGGGKRLLLIVLGIAAVGGAVAFFSDRTTPQRNEALPPIAQGATLDRDQIRYCLSEDIRLEAARRVIQADQAGDVRRFNAMVADYNGRCASFRYRSGVLPSVRSEVEARRQWLEMEGAARFPP